MGLAKEIGATLPQLLVADQHDRVKPRGFAVSTSRAIDHPRASQGEPTHADQNVSGNGRHIAAVGLDEHVLDMLRIHYRCELDRTVEVPLHPATGSALAHPRLEP